MRRIAAAFLAILLGAGQARAQATTSPTKLSPYEAETLRDAVQGRGASIDPAAEGKTLEDIEVVALDIVEPRDPVPLFFNIVHTTTRTDVIRNEVLVHVGEPYRQYRVDETVRALRAFPQLSLVLAVPLRGSRPDRVKLLVITKDVFSLRLNWELKLGSKGLDFFRAEPTERNIAGTLNSALARFELFPETITFGGGVFVPRLGHRYLYMVNEANVVLGRDSGTPEGTFGNVGLSTPQISSDQPWIGGVGIRWANVNVRRYVGARLANFDAPSTPEEDVVPDMFRARSLTHIANVTRSFGTAHKIDVQVGAELNVRRYVGLDPSRYDPRVVADYERLRVPRTDLRAAPYVQLRAYESTFLRVHDLDLLGLAEDHRTGYDAWVRAYPVTRAVGSSRDFLGVDAFAQYVVPFRDGYARASAEALVEVEARDVPTEMYLANLMVATPMTPVGRIIMDGIAITRPENYLNGRSGLGGEGRLRGYPSGAFLGENLLAYNVELRTRPVEILSAQFGGALFYDVGDAFDDRLPALPKSSVGFGFRTLVPQLDRKVWRLDIAFPLVRGAGAGPVAFYLAFEQAFPSGIVTAPGAGPAYSFLNPTGGALGQ